MRRLASLALTLIVLFPALSFAQGSITGTVRDSTGSVLPGVTVTALHVASGNTFVGVSDERGTYRVAVRVGAYTITAELQGFSTLSTENVEVLEFWRSMFEFAPPGAAELSLVDIPVILGEGQAVTGIAWSDLSWQNR